MRRRDCPTDKRGQLAELTDAGFAGFGAAAPGHVAGVRQRLFDQLSEEEIGQLRRISDRILANLADHHPAAALYRAREVAESKTHAISLAVEKKSDGKQLPS